MGVLVKCHVIYPSRPVPPTGEPSRDAGEWDKDSWLTWAEFRACLSLSRCGVSVAQRKTLGQQLSSDFARILEYLLPKYLSLTGPQHALTKSGGHNVIHYTWPPKPIQKFKNSIFDNRRTLMAFIVWHKVTQTITEMLSRSSVMHVFMHLSVLP